MFKRIVLIPAIVTTLCVLVSSSVFAQSKEDGERLFQEGQELQQKARFKEDLEKAVEKYEQALKIFKAVKFDKGIGWVANQLGLVYADWGQYDKAEDSYEKALAIQRELKDRKGEGATLGNLGIVYAAWGQYDKAVDSYGKSLAIAQEFKDRRSETNALNNLGLVYAAWGQYDKAADSYEKSLAIRRELKDRSQEGRTLGNLGTVYKNWGQYDKAVLYYEKSLAIAQEFKDRTSETNALNNLGNVYADWGQYDKAVNSYEKALAIQRELKDRKGEGATLGNLGIVYKNWGQYDKAVDFYEKSLALEREIKDRWGEGATLDNLGNVYKSWGQYDQAVDCCEKALAIQRELKDRKGEGLTLNQLGTVYSAWREYDKALASFQRGLEIYVNIGVPTTWPKDLIGNLYLDKDEVGNAEALIKEAGYSSSLGRLHLLKQDYQGAKEQYEKLRQLAEKNRKVDDLFTAYTGLGTTLEGMGDNKKAAEHYLKAVDLSEDLRSSLNPSERETFFDVRINGFYRTAPYEGLARVLVKMNKPLEAMKQSEYTRARIFAEAVSKRGEYTGIDVPRDVREKDSLLTDELSALTKNLQKAYEKQNQGVIASLEPQVKQAKRKLASHVDILRKQYPLFAATRYPEPMGLDQTALRHDEWVLAYHVTDPGLIVYLTKGKNLIKALFKPIPRKEIDDLVRRFREPLEMKGSDDITGKLKSFDFPVGKNLSDLLFGDVLSALPKDTPLIIVPDDCLGVLPFEMLPLNDGGKIATDKKIPYASGAEFFGDRNLVSYYQSVTALTLARTYGKEKGSRGRLLVVADPVFRTRDSRAQSTQELAQIKGAEAKLYVELMAVVGTGSPDGVVFPRLPLTSTLAGDLAKMFQGSAESYTGLEASKERFLKQVAPSLFNYDKIVFATHGYFGKDLPGIREPVLILTLVPPGTDGFLRMSEVVGLKMNADLVALTACQTGLGKRISGEGTMGMGRAFQYAGAKCVLMSLWNVSEKASIDLVESIFKHMKEGKTKTDALKLARQEVRDQGYDHPFFWASFILVGEVN